MSSLSYLNQRAQLLQKNSALALNIIASQGLQQIMKSNLGPKGTLKMLVGGAGQIKLTKDGNVLLKEMQIQHPTASMIARAATAQDDIVGDGTTSNVLFIAELMKQAERYINEGVHPRIITEGIDIGKDLSLKFLEQFKVSLKDPVSDKVSLTNVARTSLMTKLHPSLANHLVDIVVEAVQLIHRDGFPLDLFMVEIMHMIHQQSTNTKLVKGLVLDHGARHPDMPNTLKKCYTLVLNVSLEYEKTEVNGGFFFSNAADREKLVASERKLVDEKCQKIVDFKHKLCQGTEKNMIIINQKGIDPQSLDIFAKAGIIALRRAKRRNMERLTLACGGKALNSVDDLSPDDVGYAEEVYQQELGDEKYTFIEGVTNPHSCTILIKGPNEHTIAMIKDAIRDGLRSVKNMIDDNGYIPGGGAFEIGAYDYIQTQKETIPGKAKLGVEAFAEALLVIPKVLAENSGYDKQEMILQLLDEYKKNDRKIPVGLNLYEQGTMNPIMQAVYDNYIVKKQFLNIAPILAQQLLLVDEIMKAGVQMGKDKFADQE